MRRRKILVALLISLAAAFLGGGLAWPTNQGLSVDLLYFFGKLAGRDKTAERSPEVVIVAIDEATYYDAPDFQNKPHAFWTPYLGSVVDRLLDSGAKVIGFDQIYSTSADTDLEGYGRALKNFDQPFLLALHKGAADGRIVLGKAQHRHITQPTTAQIFAVGDTGNLRSLNLSEDPDGVLRRLPLAVDEGDERLPTMATELAARGAGRAIAFEPDGSLDLGATRYGNPTQGILVDFRPWLGPLNAFSLGDLYACAKSGRDAYFRENFAGRIVVVGQILDTEDRRLTSARLADAPESYIAPPCVLPADATHAIGRSLMPGTVLIAAGIDNLLRDAPLRPAKPLSAAIAIWVLTAIATFAAIRRASPRSVTLIIGGTALAWTLAAAIAFDFGRVAPLVSGWAALALALAFLFAWRILSGDRARLGLARAFALYLPQSEIDRLLQEEKPPALGGEERPVTILFSDIAGFTKLSEHRAPAELVADLNAYFGRMTEIVETHGGFVDKFIGDGLLAVFGAPLHDPDHAAKAVTAALDMLAALDAPAHPLRLGPDHPIAIRIGIHSGEAVVGNIGSPKRFNYTVIGDAVNLAARLEGVAKLYGVPLVVSETTREACGDTHRFRELDTVRVVGRGQPVRLYQPLAPAAAAGLDLDGFAAALAAWRSGQFVAAAEAFEKLAGADPAAAPFAARARDFAQTPPAGWQGITDLASKGG